MLPKIISFLTKNCIIDRPNLNFGTVSKIKKLTSAEKNYYTSNQKQFNIHFQIDQQNQDSNLNIKHLLFFYWCKKKFS